METWKHLRAILLLPGMLAVVIPGTILLLTGLDTGSPPRQPVWACRSSAAFLSALASC